MDKKSFGLSEDNLKKLEEIENRILDLEDLEDRMDLVDQLVIWSVFPDSISDGQEEQIDEYLRDFVMEM